MRRSSEHPEADFTRRIATEHGTILNKNDTNPHTGRSDGGADTRKPPANNCEVSSMFQVE
jgi:hypothetical protein